MRHKSPELTSVRQNVDMALWSTIGLLSACLVAGHVTAQLMPFNCIDVSDYVLDKSGARPIRLSEQQCAMRCMDSASYCTGYHFAKGLCHLLVAGTNWHEKRSPSPLRICILRDNPQCQLKRFPWAFERSRYVLVQKKKYWRYAAAHCESLGAKLVQLSSPSEQQFIGKRLKKVGKAGASYITGLMKLPSYRKNLRAGWFWHRSGDPLDPIIAWSAGEPISYTTAGAVYYDGKLDDIHYYSAAYFICECLVI